MENSRIHIRYAKALFDLAIEQRLLEQVFADMKLISETICNSRELDVILRSPIIQTEKKLSIIKNVFQQNTCILTQKYLEIIVRKRRESFIKGIANGFIHFYKEHKKIKEVIMRTAVPLEKDTCNRIIDIMKQKTGFEIELKEIVDPKLIGGFVITMDDKQFDSSILKQVKRLKKEFDINLYKKGF